MSNNLIKCLCGISDEAGSTLDQQVAAHRELGWELIELRFVDGTRVVDLPHQDLRRVRSSLNSNGLRVVAIDTGIGGWDRTIRSSFQRELDELKRSIDCAKVFGTRFLRIMSFLNAGLTADEWRAESLDRIAALVEIARTGDVVLVHENCVGWASQGQAQTLEMLSQINSPHLRLLFDTGNPVAYGQDGLAFVNAIARWVEHVHIKDAAILPGGELEYTLPGAGGAHVALCIDTLFRHGYQGAFSIEPHRAYLPHLGNGGDDALKWETYLSYGRHFRVLLKELIDPHKGVV